MLRLREMRSVLEKAKTQGVSMQRRLVLYWFSMALAILAAVLLKYLESSQVQVEDAAMQIEVSALRSELLEGQAHREVFGGALPASRNISLFFKVHDAELAFQPGWPHVNKVNGEVFVEESGVRILASKGQLLDTQVKDVYVNIPHAPAGGDSHLLLTGGFDIPESVSKLFAESVIDLPIAITKADTYPTAVALQDVRGTSTGSMRKIEVSRAMFSEYVDEAALLAAIDLPRTEIRTPTMFEYQIQQQARANRQRIVLPESTDDRVLEAAAAVLQRSFADIILLGDAVRISARATELGLNLSAATVVNPDDPELVARFAEDGSGRWIALRHGENGLTPENGLVIGDSLSTDIQGANNAGLPCCWYNPAGKARPEDLRIDYEIRDLRELLDIV